VSTRVQTSGSFQRACAVSEIAPESALAVEIGTTDIAVVHSGGEFFAVADECTHAAVPLSEGDVGDCEIECYLHGSRFDLRTGEALGLPATEPVAVYPVEVRDDEVYVDLAHPIKRSS